MMVNIWYIHDGNNMRILTLGYIDAKWQTIYIYMAYMDPIWVITPDTWHKFYEIDMLKNA